MTRNRKSWGWFSALGIGSAIASCFDCALAQITPDGTLPNNSVVTPQGTERVISGGTQAGGNLFHSFEEFSVPTGGEAHFNNPVNIQNIISRVTGGSISDIDGLISARGPANLFLLNPNGIIFGPNASLDIGGSFLGSTASAVNFADGTQFSATAHPTTPLLTVSVPLGLQFGRTTSGDISVQGSSLEMQAGKTLSLVGGDVRLDGGNLQAPGGRVELEGLAGAGTVGLDVDGNNLRLSLPDGVARANMSLTNGAEVDVNGDGGGSITLNAQNIDVLGGTFLYAGIGSGSGSVDSQAGDITLNATEAISVANESLIVNLVEPGAQGKGGGVNVTTGSLSVTNGGQLSAKTTGEGDAGSVTINARDTVSFDGITPARYISGAFSVVAAEAVGKGGDVNITTGSLSVTNGARLSTNIVGQGDAGSVTINARNSVSFDGESSDGYNSGVFSVVAPEAVSQGGSINITTGSLFVTNGAQLQTATLGQGDAGNVTIDARDTVSFDGIGSYGYNISAAISAVDEEAVGKGGSINITTGSLFVTNGAALNSYTFGQGDAGSMTINARDTVSFDGEDSYGESTIASSSVREEGVGKGGSINITTGSLFVTDGAQLQADTRGQGDAGSVNINARNTVSFDGESSDGAGSGAFSDVDQGAMGKGGGVNITTESLSVTNGAQLVSVTKGQGDAGSVNINAHNTVSFDGESSDGAGSGAFTTVEEEEAVGKGGGVNITTGSLSVTNGAQLIASTRGQGDAGSVTINARDTVSFDGEGSDGNPSAAFSTVDEEGEGKGGGVNITTGSLSVTNGAQLISSTLGRGDAGSVTINAHDTVSFDGEDSDGKPSGAFSTVEEEAVGKGGGVNITTGLLSLANGAKLTASNTGNGAAGNIEVSASSIRLDEALLSSNTVGGEGNIRLRSPDLILRRGSSITTNATGSNITGGNITIDTDVLAALENSDISANSDQFFGGEVRINAQGIFGTEFRDAPTKESDITATGGSPELSGTVEINTLDVDPSQGLVELPTVPIDTEVVQACQRGGTVAKSEFIITGRGGLPPNPGNALSTDAVQVDLVTLNPEVEQPSTTALSTSPTSPTPAPIVEAQGWVIDANGNVVLTATAPRVTPHSSWQRPAQCHGSSTFHEQPLALGMH